MDGALPIPLAFGSALVLAGVFVVAGVAKLRRPDDTAADFAAQGLPRSRLLATVVPVVELGCAVLLVVLPGWGGVAAFGLLATFSANLVAIIRSGRVVSCSCFGASRRTPVSSTDLVRNGVLGLLALAAATIGQPIWGLW